MGDWVRLSKYKHVFEKSYTPNWTTELFKIFERKATNPATYRIEDHDGNLIDGAVYEAEMQKTKYPGQFLVEKILKRINNRELVKWLGFDEVAAFLDHGASVRPSAAPVSRKTDQ